MKRKIRDKVLLVILTLSISVNLIFTALEVTNILSIRDSVVKLSETLGVHVTNDTRRIFTKSEENDLYTIAYDRAMIAEERLNNIKQYTIWLSQLCSRILSNPKDYIPRRISFSVPDDIIKGRPYLWWPDIEKRNKFRYEVDLLENAIEFLGQVVNDVPSISESFLAGEYGYFINFDEYAKFDITDDFDPRNTNWYREAKRTGKAVWTDIIIDPEGRSGNFFCVVPVYDLSKVPATGEKTFKGVAGAGSLLSQTIEEIVENDFDSENIFFMLDSHGQVICKPDSTGVLNITLGENLLGNEYSGLVDLAEKMINGDDGVTEFKIGERELIAAYYPLKSVDWSFCTVISSTEIVQTVDTINNGILDLFGIEINNINREIYFNIIKAIVIAIIITGITIFLCIKLANGLTKPISELCNDAQTIGAGYVNKRLKINTNDELETLADTINQMIDNIEYITGEKQRISTELNVAARLQAGLLPNKFPAFPDRKEFDIYAEMHPAKEVGGDFYDFFMISHNKIAAVIADVSGKGIGAALFMARAKTIIKIYVRSGMPPAEAFNNANRMLCENNDTEMFVTAFLAVLDLDTGLITYVNAGHNPPIVKSNDKTFKFLDVESGLILGYLPDYNYKPFNIQLQPNDLLFLYTDGVNESFSIKDEEFGSDRILQTMREFQIQNEEHTLKEFIQYILNKVSTFADGAEQSDDITLLMLKYCG